MLEVIMPRPSTAESLSSEPQTAQLVDIRKPAVASQAPRDSSRRLFA